MSGRQHPTDGDQTTRAAAQSEFRVPVVVEAGAGTGKTALLVARVAAWCVGDGWARHADDDELHEAVAREVLRGVVAITFTEAAAAEMATRIGEALSGLAAGRAPVGWAPGGEVAELEADELAARAAALAGETHRLAVTTIHAFCQRLLAAHPFEAGLHPRFEVDADGSVVEAIVDEVVAEALRELERGAPAADWERLAGAGVGPAMIAEALRDLVAAGARPADLARDPFDGDLAATMAGDLLGSIRALLATEAGRLGRLTAVKVAQRTVEGLVAAQLRLESIGERPGFDDLGATLDLIDSDARKRLRKWSRSDFAKGELTALGADADDFAELAGELFARLDGLRGLEPENFGAARRILAELLATVERRRTARGVATFQDLLERAADLLEAHDAICRAERRGLDQLLVDEFQDTDDVQCRIVRRLALEGPADERPGLFVVGDPKQSIYAWRSADLEAYDRFVELVEAGGGLRLPLTRNFRSVKPILDEVERVVAPVMVREHGIQPAFEALEATGERAASPGFEHLPWSAVEHWICWTPDDEGRVAPPGRRTSDITSLEAVSVAGDIRRLHDEAGVRFGDVAVLLRTTTAQEELLTAFRELGVPFEVARERRYYRQREIVEAAALVRAVLEPGDAVALLTVLRSDAVGVPDGALAPLWDGGLPSAATRLGDDPAALEAARGIVRDARVPDGLPGLDAVPGWRDALTGALDSLAELRRSIRTDPPDLFVERLRTLWLAEVTAAARHLGRFRQARLDTFLAELEATLVRGAGGSAEIARFLRRAVAEEREAPSVSEPDLDADAVHVMTIYGAKGLDFEHVYLVQTHRGTGSSSGPAAVLRRHAGTAELELFGWRSPGMAAAERRRDLQAKAEAVRLLYVAMTRAKQRLVVSGGWTTPGETVAPRHASSLVELVAHRGDPSVIGRLLERGVDREADREPGVSWVVPALVDEAPVPPGPDPEPLASAIDAAAVAADAGAVARARRAAADRMAARWSSPASDAAHRGGARLEADPEAETPAGGVAARRDTAAVVGTVIHRLLESLDLSAELAPQVEGSRKEVIAAAAAELGADDRPAAAERLGGLLDCLARGSCLCRLGEVAPSVVARELVVLLWPIADDGTSVVSGAVDLVYTDPDDGRLVVADFKTDAVATDAEVADRVERYRPQLATYAGALQQALELDGPPHTELWFLDADRIVRLVG
ncbi:MAG TPA: UvrD-helicase domain-containing protein [Methylomirabilota bacterium]|nr:UvrD-helicase domain-containing protein [Methylomirabilota bacterium]